MQQSSHRWDNLPTQIDEEPFWSRGKRIKVDNSLLHRSRPICGGQFKENFYYLLSATGSEHVAELLRFGFGKGIVFPTDYLWVSK